ncbi:expressed unknown protein [Seminavis robusta]|uniref:Uncharacterized protein n=1 Tax=Seminavis robusta TaxID=568900 RepID=A0A9N8H7A8_9STRA|nr:expressed unknown protein [Seminavis robusta]|eukprot:Sro135_g063882.1  (152) ;mRNA; f:98918-99373
MFRIWVVSFFIGTDTISTQVLHIVPPAPVLSTKQFCLIGVSPHHCSPEHQRLVSVELSSVRKVPYHPIRLQGDVVAQDGFNLGMEVLRFCNFIGGFSFPTHKHTFQILKCLVMTRIRKHLLSSGFTFRIVNHKANNRPGLILLPIVKGETG